MLLILGLVIGFVFKEQLLELALLVLTSIAGFLLEE